MRIERLIPCPRRELWRALIQHAELGEHGPVLRLALPGGVSATAGKITFYRSERILECAWGIDVLRWELHARGEQTLLVFTHAENAAPWLACLDSLAALVKP
jgi:hypothetical protein